MNCKLKTLFSTFSVLTLIGSSTLILIGCMVGPDFEKPCGPDTDNYIEKDPSKTTSSKGRSGSAQRFVKCADIPAEWWRLFHSPELNCLIEQGLRNSPNVKAAEASLCQASQNLRAGIGLLIPGLTATGGGIRQRINAASFDDITGNTPPLTLNLFNTSVNVNYPVDFWGGIRRQIEGLAALVDYQKYLYEATYTTLAANIATTAITEASLRAQIEATKDLINLNQEQLDIFYKQFKLGGVSKVTVLTQETQVAILRSLLPPLEKNLAQTRHALSMLIGELPSENCLPKFSLDNLHLPKDLPISVPSCLVEQRPDVQAASALLHQASAQIGVATANMLPQLTISGSFGYLSTHLSTLFSPPSMIWNLGAQATYTIMAGGRLIAQKEAAIAAYTAAYEKYKQSVLVAFQNVADSLRALEWDAEFLKAQTAAETAAKENLTLSQGQFKLGGVNFLQVIIANQQYVQARISRIQAEALRYADTVALFQSLGGGWWNKIDNECEE